MRAQVLEHGGAVLVRRRPGPPDAQLRARLDRRDVLLEHQLLLEFERLPIASPEMLLWAMLDSDGRRHLAVRAHQGDAAARAQLARLEQLLSGDEGAVVRAECERLHEARDANARALLGHGEQRLSPEGAATEAQRRHRAAVLQAAERPCRCSSSLRQPRTDLPPSLRRVLPRFSDGHAPLSYTNQVQLGILRHAFAWRGVIPLLDGGDAGMDASATTVAAALAFAAEISTAEPFDLLGGLVRLPRRPFDLDEPGRLLAEVAATIEATGCRVTRQASSAGVDAGKAEARRGPQGVEARRLAGADPPLDERFGAIRSRDEQPRAARHALLLNRRLGEGAAAAEEAEAGERARDSGWAEGRGLAAMAPLPARAADPGERGWEQLEAMREQGGVPDEEEEARALAGLLLSSRRMLGVRRMPRLSESEGYARMLPPSASFPPPPSPSPSSPRTRTTPPTLALPPHPLTLALTQGTGCSTLPRRGTTRYRPSASRVDLSCLSGRVSTAPCRS